MIEDEIERAKRESFDIMDVSDSPDFARDVENGNLVFYKDGKGMVYFNLKSVSYAGKRLGEEGVKYFKMMEGEVEKNKAEKLDAAEIQELLRKLKAKKDYRDHYFG
ncbi:MAG: hypothetical protein WA139_03875 [Candidatus Aenigmatarchaeota archaeon]